MLLFTAPDNHQAVIQIRSAMRQIRADFRFVELGSSAAVQELDNPDAVHQMLRSAQPACLIIAGNDLPATLIAAAAEHGIPILLSDASFTGREASWGVRAGIRKELLAHMQMIFVTDEASLNVVRRAGLPRNRIELTGPITEIHEPLTCNESERVVIAELLNGRQTWLATCVPSTEETAVIAAHLAALRQSHLALLIFMPADMSRTDEIAGQFESLGLLVSRRDMDEEPTEEVQVLITDGATEMGLWYRLAPITYIGGTLSGNSDQIRHPFEPAALGSAIVHGPATEKYAPQWQQLAGAKAARRVSDAAGLADTIAELSQPDIVAELANHAWAVSTGGAGIATRVAETALALIKARQE